MNSYFLKFNNFQSHPEGTGRLHYKVLKEKGNVLWGQWRNGVNLLNRKIKNEMNNSTPFILYELDKDVALLKLTVIAVFDKEEVIERGLEEYIPSYYDVETPCSAFYMISAMEILPPEEAVQIVNINTGSSIYYSAQVNSTTPWRVRKSEETIAFTPKTIPQKTKALPPKSTEIQITDDNSGHCVYHYRSKSTGKSYIGMTNNIIRRRREHESPVTWQREKKKYLYVLMNILGLEDFDFEILHSGLTEEEAHHWEAVEIEQHNAYYPNGLNERNESKYL
jgi:hypothetical protein